MVWAVINEAIRNATTELVQSTSTRVVAVLGGSVIDEALRRALESRLVPDQKFIDDLFGEYGPLGSLGTKIKLGYALRMYNQDSNEALTGILDIRNLFAHRLGISFDSDDKKMKKAIARMRLHEKYKKYPHPMWNGDSEYDVETPKDHQDRFIINLRILLCLLMRDDLLHRPNSNDPVELAKGPIVV
jgi:hypothetical protein